MRLPDGGGVSFAVRRWITSATDTQMPVQSTTSVSTFLLTHDGHHRADGVGKSIAPRAYVSPLPV